MGLVKEKAADREQCGKLEDENQDCGGERETGVSMQQEQRKRVNVIISQVPWVLLSNRGEFLAYSLKGAVWSRTAVVSCLDAHLGGMPNWKH